MVRFHTTDLIPNGQGVSVEVTGWSCEGDFQLRVYQPNTFNDCDALEYLPASDLLRASGDTTLVTEELYRNWDYILLISSDQVGCELNVKLTGRSMSIDACCAANIDYGDSTQVEVLGSDWMLGFDWVPEEYASMSGDRQATLAPYQTTTFFVTAYIEECAYQDAVLVVTALLWIPGLSLRQHLTALRSYKLVVVLMIVKAVGLSIRFRTASLTWKFS